MQTEVGDDLPEDAAEALVAEVAAIAWFAPALEEARPGTMRFECPPRLDRVLGELKAVSR